MGIFIKKDKYGSRRKYTKRKCEQCGKKFDAVLKNIRIGKARFCCMSCFRESQKKQVDMVCSNCGKKFTRAKARLNCSRHGIYFCSRECKDIGQRIGGISKIQPPHYGNGKRNYRDIAFRAYKEKCLVCGYNDDPRILEVHHIDNNRENNKLENLIVLCPICHRKITLRYYSLVIKGNGSARGGHLICNQDIQPGSNPGFSIGR